MEILSDITEANGKHTVRVQLDDGSCRFLQYPSTPSLQTVTDEITRHLRNQEFESIVTSNTWTNPVYWTKAEFAARFRELYLNARGEIVWALAYWLIERINDVTFTDTQVRNAFGLTVNQYNALKPRLQTNHDKHLERTTAQGE